MEQKKSRLIPLLQKHAQALPYFGASASASFLRAGIANIAFRVESSAKSLLVKFAVAPASKPTVFIQAGYEKKLAEKISSLDISPRFLSFGSITISGRKFPYSVQEFVDGSDLDYSKDLPSVARLLHRLHHKTRGKKSICQYRVEDVETYLEKKAQIDAVRSPQNSPINKLAKLAKARLEKSEPSTGNYQCLIHNDLTSENILISKNRPYLIDWGWAMYSCAALDVCNILSPFNSSWARPYFINKPQAIAFLNSYFKGFDEGDRENISSSIKEFWIPYNSLIANWIANDFLPIHPIGEKHYFHTKPFQDKAFAHTLLLQKFFEKSLPV
ncbi:MAG: phosphotransferase [Candidatus Micrarchaeota archaeon]